MKQVKQIRLFKEDKELFDEVVRPNGLKLSSVIEYIVKEDLSKKEWFDKPNFKNRKQNNVDDERTKILTSISIDSDLVREIHLRNFKIHSYIRNVFQAYCNTFRKTEEFIENVSEEFKDEEVIIIK